MAHFQGRAAFQNKLDAAQQAADQMLAARLSAQKEELLRLSNSYVDEITTILKETQRNYDKGCRQHACMADEQDSVVLVYHMLSIHDCSYSTDVAALALSAQQMCLEVQASHTQVLFCMLSFLRGTNAQTQPALPGKFLRLMLRRTLDFGQRSKDIYGQWSP